MSSPSGHLHRERREEEEGGKEGGGGKEGKRGRDKGGCRARAATAREPREVRPTWL